MITKPSLRATVIQMNENDVIYVSMKERTYHTIRNTAYNVSREMGRRYRVRKNKLGNYCEITRLNDE